MEEGSAATRGGVKTSSSSGRRRPSRGNGDASSLCPPGECVRGLSKCPKTLVFYARDVRAGRWRRNALPVTNAGKSSNTSRLSDITKAAVVDPEAKPHVPLQNTAHERRSQRGGTRKSIRTKNLDTSVKMEKDKPKPKHPTPTCRFSTLKNREQSSGKRTFLFL